MRRVKRALVLLIVALALQPLCVFASMALPVAPAATTMSADDSDGDDFDLICGGDAIVIAGVALPLPEPYTDVANPAPAQIPPRAADPADHPPRPA